MATMNISLPDPMKEFIETQAASEGFGSVSEYLRSIFREIQRRQAKQALDAKLREALDGPPPTPMTRSDWEGLEQAVWDRHRREQTEGS